MKIGIYSAALKKTITQNVFNMLLISEVGRLLPPGSLLAFCREQLTELTFFDITVPVKPVKSSVFGLLGSVAERGFAMPMLLKKEKISTLIIFDTGDVLSAPVNQFLILNDQYRYHKKDAAAFRKLKRIVVSSLLLKEYLLENAAAPAEKIIVLSGLLRRSLKPADVLGTMAFKDALTGGKEFFICNDEQWTKEKLVVLLKAFSRFKKMQQTSWKLLLTQRGEDPRASFNPVFEALKNYRYKEDVVLFQSSGNEQYAQALSAAYMAVSLQEGPGYPAGIMEALCCGTPVIVPEGLEHSAGFSLPSYSEKDEEPLAKKMMEQYKNEGLRHKYADALRKRPVISYPGNGLDELLKHLLPA
ncbi:hypothetical protein A8C56_19270 [Niabella ginsenosidivorans]|uniref:Glycosyl transferase family 1 domain-containing protein n=1 Tax=Niabella ginsenosidivorans TaxID=1176587 RepID=A0A1A9I580_9BACT|nr:glycosyltransferase [Niabella ginsenosidivorans]ANH82838.1 hypothetical protein A8C56_19270 [Niabella ginsenosidivorans]